MKLLVLFVMFVVFFLSASAYPQAYFRDPFESLLPKEPEEVSPDPTGKRKPEEELLVTVEGVLWDSDLPQTIIDGDVYRVGDKLKEIDAKVFRIDKNVVYIAKGDKIYKKTVEKKEGK